MKKLKIILNGMIKENPTFVLFLGMCPVLATSKSIYSAIGMSACVFLVLLLSNIAISLIAKITPSEIRIPVYIVIIATIVTVVSMLTETFAAGIYTTLGKYLQLIVVNCIILGRAESYASKNGVVNSIMDAIGISLGFFFALTLVAAFREILGTGAITMCDLEGNEVSYTQILPLTAQQKEALAAAIKAIEKDASIAKAAKPAEILKAKMSFVSPYAIGLLAKESGAFLTLGLCVAGFTSIKTAVETKKAAKLKKAAESK